MRRGTRAVVALLVAGVIGLVPALAAAAGSEAPVVVRVGESGPSFNFAVVPSSLPKGSGPAELKVSIGDEFSVGVPPGIAGATIGLGRSIGFDFGGVPRCPWGIQIDAAGPNECADAAVGHAGATVIVAFPEVQSITLHSRGTVYNAGGGRLLVKLRFTEPVSGEIGFLVPLRTGSSGSEMSIVVPEFAGGNGQLTSLDLSLERPYVTAECHRGKLRASANVVLGDGSEENFEAIRACTGG